MGMAALASLSTGWYTAGSLGFFDGVGSKDGAGYGFAGRPADPPGFRERQRKLRAARARAEDAVGS